ncbi:putative oxidoreductase [Cladophialophora carrionii]|uniref:Putative oxidoreductase n=1 Tax=Cladophialophora carrionii TaxID=86049 RepID=A0A1C1CIE1_9EURO|nr:putative oxidoreductase [Cladophialophora carrionii]
MSEGKGQFEQGFLPKVTHQDPPGREGDLPVEAIHDKLPTPDGGWQEYKAAGKLEGKKAFITGSSTLRGIGRAIAILFAKEGADSFIVYLPEEEEDAKETQKRVEAEGRKCHLFPTDVRKYENCEKAVKAAQQALGKINILVNNAAYQMMQMDITEIPLEQWHKTFETNIHPYFYFAKLIVPHMKRGDTVINNASINAYIGRPDLLDYTSTKGGPVWTPLIPSTMNEDAQKQFTSPLGRPAQPSEIATSFVFLASPDSSMISGHALHPNGGTVLNT